MTPRQRAEYDYATEKAQKLHDINIKLNVQIQTLQEQVAHWKRKANAKK